MGYGGGWLWGAAGSRWVYAAGVFSRLAGLREGKVFAKVDSGGVEGFLRRYLFNIMGTVRELRLGIEGGRCA